MEEEYEIQHFGFSVAELRKETTDMIHDEVDKACAFLVESITTSPQVDGSVATEIDQKKNILATDIKNLLKEPLDEMGNIIKEHFTIPPNVTLSTDIIKWKSINASEETLQAQHDDLLKRFMMLEQFNCALNDELDKYNKMDSVIKIQNDAIEVVEATLAAQPDSNYIKELAANINTKFNV